MTSTVGTPYPNDLQRRRAVEVRRADGDQPRLIGVAVRYHSIAEIGPFREQVAPGAFERTLSSDADIVALADHDPTRLLARRSSGSLRLFDRDDGLHFELDLPNTQAGNDAYELAKRADLGGVSFGFLIRPDGERRDGDLRTLTDVDLIEISIVQAWPAYPDTVVEARRKPCTTIKQRKLLAEVL